MEAEVIGDVFSPEVLEQARTAERMQAAHTIGKRVDLRAKTVLTFSGMDGGGQRFGEAADCGVSIEKNDKYYTLGIHTADIDYFVPVGSPVDKEAKKRFLSYILPDRVRPMLPAPLADGSCFLAAKQNRLAVTLFFDISFDGRLVAMRAVESVVCAAANCVLAEVDNLYANPDSSSVLPLRRKYAAVLDTINLAYELAALFYAGKQNADRSGTTRRRMKFVFNNKGVPVDIIASEEQDATLMLRELLNFAAANLRAFLQKAEIPCILSRRPPLDIAKLVQLAALAGIYLPPNMLISCSCKDDTDRLYELEQYIFDKAGTTAHSELLSILAEAWLPPTEYKTGTDENENGYVFFCNPAERYTDLVVQRALKLAVVDQEGKNRTARDTLLRQIKEAVKTANERESIYKHLKYESSQRLFGQMARENPGNRYSAFVIEIQDDHAVVCLDCGLWGQVKACDGKQFIKTDDRSFICGNTHHRIGDQITVTAYERNEELNFLPAE